MVVARVRIAVEDPLVAERQGLHPETVETSDEPFFLDGPLGPRVAVIDRDPATGQLAPPVPWRAESRSYAASSDLSAPEAISVSVFGTVMQTLALFERKDVLGHRIRWHFDSPQLLVVPRAGLWANAFYDRYSQSLQFFSFRADDESTVHTALSRDIVSHETGHAILDALAPALYDALSPESLALHEAIGDLTANLMALQSRQIRDWLLRIRGGGLEGTSPVSELATQFGFALHQNRPLRDAFNSVRIEDIPAPREPHALSQVLTGAIWAAMIRLHSHAVSTARAPDPQSSEDPLGRALAISALRMARILFRALDYLPPAEATFADYARAILRSDCIAYAEDETGYREVLQQEFVARGIVADGMELACEPSRAQVKVDLDDVQESDWAAYAFAGRERALLGIPPRVPFRLFPRREILRRYYLGGGQHEDRRELVFQVTWEEPEENSASPLVSSQRAVFHGTTLVLGGEPDARGRHPVLSCLTTDRSSRQVQDRNDMVRSLAENGFLRIGESWEAMKLRPFEPAVFGRVTDGLLRLRGTARLLHLAENIA